MPLAAAAAPLVGGVIGAGATIYGANKAAKSAKEAAKVQEQLGREAMGIVQGAGEEAQQYLTPYSEFGQQNLAPLQQMLTPQGQADYLSQNNPLFQAALENANRQTTMNAAIRGRTGAGDTQLNYLKNWQATAMPLIQNQQSALFNAAGIGQTAGSQRAQLGLNTAESAGGLLTGIANAKSAGIVGAGNAWAKGAEGVAKVIGQNSDAISGFIKGFGKP